MKKELCNRNMLYLLYERETNYANAYMRRAYLILTTVLRFSTSYYDAMASTRRHHHP
jgi:hypothetical protein